MNDERMIRWLNGSFDHTLIDHSIIDASDSN
jgi:hypothetical protein